MKKIISVITIMVVTCLAVNAQGMLGRLKDRAKDAVERNLGDKVEKGVDNILNGKGNKDRNKSVF